MCISLEFTIRAYKDSDVEVVYDLFRQLDDYHAGRYPQQFIFLDEPASREFSRIRMEKMPDILVAETKGKVIGFIQLVIAETRDIPVNRKKRFVLIENISVDKSHRGKGVGKALVENAKDWAYQKGILCMRVGAYATNEPAVGLYKKAGFKELTVNMEINF
jgi:ribosomal protein S18 acetylase RimI-like enzyme